MATKAREQLVTKSEVVIAATDLKGIIKGVGPEVTEGEGPVYTIELENGETRHFTINELK